MERNSYLRWSPGPLYGFTPHSGVALLPVWSDPPLAEVFQRLYLQQCILLLYLRTALFFIQSRDQSVVMESAEGDNEA